MKPLESREKKIFITVFLIIGLFVQFYGVNENSRFNLTQSIVDNQAFHINDTHYNTGDRSLYQDTYYSDKEPGLSFLGAPVYAAWKSVYSLAGGDTSINHQPQATILTVNDIDIYYPINPGDFYLSSLILVVLLTSTLSLAILTVLIYRLSQDFVENESKRLLLTFGFAFGTLLTHTGTNFLPDAPSTLLAFSSSYLLYQWKTYPGSKKMAFAGFLGGFAVVISSLTAIVLIFNALYAFKKFGGLPYLYTLGGFIGGLPFMIYNTLIFGNPLSLPRTHLDPNIWPNLQQVSGITIEPILNLYITFRLLFMPYRGIFLWFPILVLSLFGYKQLLKKDKELGLLVGGIFVSGVIFVSTWWAWWHGGFFGVRHLTFLVPFAMIPIFAVADKIDIRVITILVSASILINLAGFQGHYEDELKDLENSSEMKPEYQEKVKTLQPLSNPLKDYYFDGFLSHGVNSGIVSGLYNGDLPADIRGYNSYENRAPQPLVFGIITFSVLLIWEKDLQRFFNSSSANMKKGSLKEKLVKLKKDSLILGEDKR